MREEEIDKVKAASTKPTTANYNLIKPEQTDFYDVDDFNSNMDKIDAQLKIISDLNNGTLKFKGTLREKDVKTITESGIYKMILCTNVPVDYGILEVLNADNYIEYNATNVVNNARHTMTRRDSGEFTEWEEPEKKGHKHTKSDITDFPTSLPAKGGNADTVGGIKFNWRFGTGSPTHIWGSTGNATDMEVFKPEQVRVSHATTSSVAHQLQVPASNFDTVPIEIGRHIDFHRVGSNADYDARLSLENGGLVFKSAEDPSQTMSITAEINVLKSSVVSGKQLVVNAINERHGYSTGLTTNNTFNDYAWWIGQIPIAKHNYELTTPLNQLSGSFSLYGKYLTASAGGTITTKSLVFLARASDGARLVATFPSNIQISVRLVTNSSISVDMVQATSPCDIGVGASGNFTHYFMVVNPTGSTITLNSKNGIAFEIYEMI